MEQKKRIAIYGGTFDPVHLGHLEVARRLSELFEIDEVLFVPARLAPHKQSRDVTSALHRYAMLALAIQTDQRLTLSTFELEAQGRGYTVDTISHFENLYGYAVELFFIMGADSWLEITTWHEWERLLTMTNHIVVSRPGYDLKMNHVPGHIQQRISDLRGLAKLPQASLGGGDYRIYVTDAAMVDVSATDIRAAAKLNEVKDLVGLVPLSVAHYIKKYRLYRNSNEV